jgi:hypothetical protein
MATAPRVRANLYIICEDGVYSRNRGFDEVPEVGDVIRYLGMDLVITNVQKTGLSRGLTHQIDAWFGGPWGPYLGVE